MKAFDPRPCANANVNVCVGEGCYGEACIANLRIQLCGRGVEGPCAVPGCVCTVSHMSRGLACHDRNGSPLFEARP